MQKSAACIAWHEPCLKATRPSLGCDRLHRAQLDDKDNPYNTYQHEGLPPGPISNPGKGSIEATLAPDGSDYYFFVAKDARNHAFARTVAEHEKNVDKYMTAADVTGERSRRGYRNATAACYDGAGLGCATTSMSFSTETASSEPPAAPAGVTRLRAREADRVHASLVLLRP